MIFFHLKKLGKSNGSTTCRSKTLSPFDIVSYQTLVLAIFRKTPPTTMYCNFNKSQPPIAVILIISFASFYVSSIQAKEFKAALWGDLVRRPIASVDYASSSRNHLTMRFLPMYISKQCSHTMVKVMTYLIRMIILVTSMDHSVILSMITLRTTMSSSHSTLVI